MADVDLANQALQLLGAAPVTSLSEASTAARAANAAFAQVRDELQALHAWNFNQVRSGLLAQDATAPTYGFTYRFALPVDPWCLRVLDTDQEENGYAWSVEGRFLLQDASTVRIHYLARITDVALWSPGFVLAFVPMLARRMAYALTKSVQIHRDMAQLAEIELKRGRGLDGLESTPKSITSTTLVTVRN